MIPYDETTRMLGGQALLNSILAMIREGSICAHPDELDAWEKYLAACTPDDPGSAINFFEDLKIRIRDATDSTFGPQVVAGFKLSEDPGSLRRYLGSQYVLLPPDDDDNDDACWDLAGDGSYAAHPDEHELLCDAVMRAGRAYQRECGWDYLPRTTDWWLAQVRIEEAFGGPGSDSVPPRVCLQGQLVGFLVASEPKESHRDGPYRIEHLWVAGQYRRRGIGSGLLSRAKSLWGITRTSGTYSRAGALFAEAMGLKTKSSGPSSKE